MTGDDNVRSAFACRACGADDCPTILDLGHTPIADRLVPRERCGEDDPLEPLEVVLCRTCGLVQITRTVPPEVLFADGYPYYSSYSPTLLEHAREHALEQIETRGLDHRSFVLEIASNDGYLLRNFSERGIPVLGVDPAAGPVAAAREIGVPTREGFFDRELATELARTGPAPNVIFANNVLAHVADLRGLVAGMRDLLAPGGVISIEVPYLVDLVDHGEFDTIYHQHLCYFSASAAQRLFAAEGLSLNRVSRQPIHGGSLRMSVAADRSPDDSVAAILRDEADRGVDRAEFYAPLRERCEELRTTLPELLARLRSRGHSVAGYGAAAKATTLLSYCSIGADTVEFIVDRNPHKHGMQMPGNRIPIVPVETLIERAPAYTLLFAWNFADEILAQQSEYVRHGGRFIIPIPGPTIRPAPMSAV